jgi:hypothetical protein
VTVVLRSLAPEIEQVEWCLKENATGSPDVIQSIVFTGEPPETVEISYRHRWVLVVNFDRLDWCAHHPLTAEEAAHRLYDSWYSGP